MNWALFPRSRRVSAIGIDLGGRVIKAVQVSVSRASGRAAVVAAVTLDRVEQDASSVGPQDVERLARALELRGFRGHDVVLAAPPARSECDLLELPPRTSGAPVDDLAAAEIGRLAKMDVGAYEAACWDVPAVRAGGSGGGGTSVLAVALRHAEADALIGPLEAAGFRVRAIDTAAWALSRALTGIAPAAFESDAQGNSQARPLMAVLDLGWNGATVTLLSGASVLYQRVLYESGVGPLYRQVADRHGIVGEAAELLLCGGAPAMPASAASLMDTYVAQTAEELGASLAFARHRYIGRPVEAVRLVGGGAKLAGFAPALSRAVQLPVSPVTPPEFVTLASGVGARGWPHLALAAGLSLHPDGIA